MSSDTEASKLPLSRSVISGKNPIRDADHVLSKSPIEFTEFIQQAVNLHPKSSGKMKGGG
jgi:hypothetical protein